MSVAGLAHRVRPAIGSESVQAVAVLAVLAVRTLMLAVVAGWPEGAAAVSCDWIVAGGDGERCGAGAGGLGDGCLVP